MDRRQEKQWKSKLDCYLFCAFLVAFLPCYLTVKHSDEVIERRLPSWDNTNNRHLIIISTLDGRLTALDVENNGAVQWSLRTGSVNLLSSSISNIELSDNGVISRLIPSLDGNIFKSSENYIESLPFTADSLLSNSYKLTEDIVIAGGKDIRRFAISPFTGKIIYKCTAQGCQNCGHEISESEDLLLVERYSQTVRALDSRNGAEKWNFSVGQHELKYDQGSFQHDVPKITNEGSETIFLEQLISFDISIPEGSISAFKRDSSDIFWKYTFESPVADAWVLKDRELKKLNTFHENHNMNIKANHEFTPNFYLGYYKNQPYIQANPETFSNKLHSSLNSDNYLKPFRIKWKPYLATASSRTPFLANQYDNPLLIGSEKSSHETALVTHGYCDYPYDTGFFLFFEDSFTKPVTLLIQEDNENTLVISIWNWWKEVLIISVINAVIIHILIIKYCHVGSYKVVSNNNLENFQVDCLQSTSPKCLSTESVQTSDTEVEVLPESSFKVENTDYVSRYLTDFNPRQCLGKGGFGIVIEATNKLDDCCYAIKRISLPNRDDAKEKVMREVKALAKLDHIGIVRYFQAWIECPPPGWQEEKDKEFLDCDLSITGVTSEVSPKTQPILSTFNPLKPFSINEEEELKNAVNSIHPTTLNLQTDTESGSFSIDWENPIPFSVNGLVGAGGDSNQFSSDQKQSKDNSFEIVFGDSGCAYQTNTKSISYRTSNIKPHSVPKLYLYIQMQLCRTESLKDWLNVNIVRDKDEILDIFDQIVSAVDYVHSCGLMHRDLKPSNIFFSLDGLIKVGDFGLVAAMTEQQGITFQNENNYKNKKHTDQVGTQLYMSPEQIAGQAYSHKVDIFSLGLIFFELIHPFTTQMERLQILMDIRKHKFPPVFMKEQSQECEFVKCLLSNNPDERPSAEEIKNNHLLKDFQPSVMYLRRPRSRTMSSSSERTENS